MLCLSLRSKLFVVGSVRCAYNFMHEPARKRREPMDRLYDLTYWFDFTMLMARNHPLVSVTTLLIGFLFHKALSTMKVIAMIISFSLATVTAIFLDS